MQYALRGCKDWSDQHLPLTTTSDEAAKMFDISIAQYVNWRNDPSVGGVDGSLTRMLAADADFLLGHALNVGLQVLSTTTAAWVNPTLQSQVDDLRTALYKSTATDREKSHCRAVLLWADGQMGAATQEWEDILVTHPTDLMALKMAHDSYFYLGWSIEMRDSVARVLPVWSASMPLASRLWGMHAFGLVETNLYRQAEKEARRGLELDPKDAWATHALSHVFEMETRVPEGLQFISTTLGDWESNEMLACHLFWHWALLHLEQGEGDAALDLWQGQIVPKAIQSGQMLDIVDAASLLWRMKFEGVDAPVDLCRQLSDVCQPHSDDHALSFNDAHVVMALLGGGKRDEAKHVVLSAENHCTTRPLADYPLKQSTAILNAFIAYNSGDFDTAVATLLPHRCRLLPIGGSCAQRDVFTQLLLMSAIQSTHYQHWVRPLLLERQASRIDSPMTKRHIARAMAAHLINDIPATGGLVSVRST